MRQLISLDESNTNKQVRHYDKDGYYIRLSVDETIANNLNEWQGWHCSAGISGLYIDYDGNVWTCNTAGSKLDRFNSTEWEKTFKPYIDPFGPNIPLEWQGDGKKWLNLLKKFNARDIAFAKLVPATKENKEKYPGFLGNIKEGFELPTTWFKCPWQACGCGADVFLAKSKSKPTQDNLPVFFKGDLGQAETKNKLVKDIPKEDIIGIEINFHKPYQILWDLGRRCNYDCSYCWSGVHNRDGAHLTLDEMVNTADKIIAKWSKGESIRWNFGGGEPTLNPNFLDFLKYLKSKNQWVLVTTNGSRPNTYWSKAVEYVNSINLSVHFEFADENKMLLNIKAICEHFDQHDDDHWLEIKLMAPPAYVEQAVNFKKTILSKTDILNTGANGRLKGTVSIVPIRGIDDSSHIIDYNNTQLELLKSQDT